VPVVVRFAEPRYVHELRTGRHSDGLTRTFKTSATAFTATLLVASSRPLHTPILSVVTDSVRRGEALGIRVAIPRARGKRVLTIQATDPEGKTAPWFKTSLVVQDGRAELKMPIAWNESAGKWKITATDVFTTRTSTASVQIK